MSDIFGGEADGLEAAEQQALAAEREPVEGGGVVNSERALTAEEVRAEEPVQAEEEVRQDPTVPLSALNESRAQLRQTQAELQQLRQQMSGLDELRREVEEARNRTRQEQEQDRFNSDPLGVLREEVTQLNQKIDQTREQDQTRAQAEVQQQQVLQTIASQVNQFKAQQPDYEQALEYLMEGRRSEFTAMGLPEHIVDQRLAMEAQEIATNALQTGRNPGQSIYELAKLRGYAEKKAAEKIEKIEKGQKAGQSLSSSSGNEGASEFSLSELTNMSDDQFDKLWAQLEASERGSKAY